MLISSVTTIVNVVSYVLVAFVGVSLVVSSIMIGIITFTGKFSKDELKTCGVTPDLSIHSIAELPRLIEKFHTPENHPA